jgi:hypothetical protein
MKIWISGTGFLFNVESALAEFDFIHQESLQVFHFRLVVMLVIVGVDKHRVALLCLFVFFFPLNFGRCCLFCLPLASVVSFPVIFLVSKFLLMTKEMFFLVLLMAALCVGAVEEPQRQFSEEELNAGAADLKEYLSIAHSVGKEFRLKPEANQRTVFLIPGIAGKRNISKEMSLTPKLRFSNSIQLQQCSCPKPGMQIVVRRMGRCMGQNFRAGNASFFSSRYFFSCRKKDSCNVGMRDDSSFNAVHWSIGMDQSARFCLRFLPFAGLFFFVLQGVQISIVGSFLFFAVLVVSFLSLEGGLDSIMYLDPANELTMAATSYYAGAVQALQSAGV